MGIPTDARLLGKQLASAALALVAFAGCKGESQPAPNTTEISSVKRPPPAIPCPPMLVAVGLDAGIQIHEIDSSCVATPRKQIPLEPTITNNMYAVAWGDATKPLYLGSHNQEAETQGKIYVLENPLGASRSVPIRIDPPGTGSPDPEGYLFSLASERGRALVEYCREWSSGDGESGGETEEWACTEHVYFDMGSKNGKPVASSVVRWWQAFTPKWTKLPGTDIEVRTQDGKEECRANGKRSSLDVFDLNLASSAGAVPVSKTEWLLATETPGSRRAGSRSVTYTLIKGCEATKEQWDASSGPGQYRAFNDSVRYGDQIISNADGSVFRPGSNALGWAPLPSPASTLETKRLDPSVPQLRSKS